MLKLTQPGWAGSGVAVVAVVALVVALTTGGTNRQVGAPGSDPQAKPAGPPTALPSGGGQLAAAIDQAQTVIDDPASTTLALESAALTEQLAARSLAGESHDGRRMVLGLLNPQARASMRANLAAADALTAIATRPRKLPNWRIVPPPEPDTLRGYLMAAQARFAVPWQDLAAIEFIETRFGRVDGVSTAGAQGPMQFLPATWASYGRGSVHDPRDAIMGAARYLVANGAPRNLARALYAYNNSSGYVNAVQTYADWMRADPRAYYGYYYWQVIYNRAGGAVILPLGYPRARPVSISK
jgi:hypothetical protein